MPEPRDPPTDAAPSSLPVLAEPRTVQPPASPSLPAAAAAAAGGFLLGVTTFVLVRVLRRPPKAGRRAGLRRTGRGAERLDIAASRSFLVDIHLLDRR